jgi:predicted dehydrogenase
MLNQKYSRRDFIRNSAAISGGAWAAKSILLEPGYMLASPRPVPPSDRIRFGIVGVGMQGSGLLGTAIKLPGIECVAASDLYDGRRELAREIVGKEIPTTRKYQELLDNKEIDAIIAAVPDHWHKQIVVDACNAGKDVYCEKPMTHAVSEGYEMIAAQQKNNRVVQIGSQLATAISSKKANELVAAGDIGDLYAVECLMSRNDPQGAWQYPPAPDLSPETLDWDTWLGTAPKIPFNIMHFTRWRCWRAYGSGIAGDLFVHMLTAMQTVAGINEAPKTATATGGLYRFKDGRDVPDVHTTLFEYSKFNVLMRCTLTTHTPDAVRFLGTKGWIELRDGGVYMSQQDGQDHSPSYYADSFPAKLRAQYDKEWHEQHPPTPPGTYTMETESNFHTPPGYDQTSEHLWNFFQAVRSRGPVLEDARFGHHAAVACHMANYAYFNHCQAVWDESSRSIVKG